MPDSKPASTTAWSRSRWVIPDDGIIDAVAVEVAASGQRPVRLTCAERREAAARILARGGTVGVVAKRLRMSGSAVRVLVASIAETEGLE